MKKTEKISVLISIVLISLIAIGAVSAADDTAAADDADLAAVDEVQAIDDTNTNDDIDYESTDIIVTDTGDSGDDNVAAADNAKQPALGANELTAGETKTFSQLADDLSGNAAMLSGAYYKYDPQTDSQYVNGINLTNGLTIIGGGATIDADNQARIFNIPTGVSVTLMNLNLINGKAEMGAAIYNNGSLTLMNSNVNDNTATIGGGGIYNNGGSLTITGTTFDGNDITDRSQNADDYGGAAIYNKKGSVLLSGSTVSNSIKNIVPRAGVDTATDLCSAAVTSEEGDLTITNCLFEKNSGCYGGAINVGGGNLMVSDSVFKDNYAFNGAALLFYGAGTYVISNSNFTHNIANGTGSGINNVGSGGAIAGTEYNEGSIIDNCIFDGNCASKGGAINCDNVKVIDSKFINNIADSTYSGDYQGTKNTVGGNGAAVYAYVNVDITGSTLNNNVAEKRGGAIYAVGSGTTVTVSDSVIDGNDITYRAENDDNGGAAIYNNGGKLTLDNVQVTNNLKNIVIREGDAGDLINAAIFTSGDTTVTNSNISKNSGSWGGGIYVTNGATLTVKDSTFEENMATFGAALYNEKAKLIVDNCDFIKNHCEGVGSSGTSNTQAGAILSMDVGSTATITNSRFKENSARVGGAVSLAGVDSSTITGCTFTENTGTSEGGAIYAWTQSGGSVTVSGNTFTDNTAPFGSAISNDGTMSITENTITGATTAPIGNYYGTITSPVYVKTLNGETVTTGSATNDITATLTDDKGNAIVDRNLVLVVNNEDVTTSYNKVTGIMTGSYTFTTPGTYEVTAKNFDATHTVAGTLVYTGGTFTELANLIAAAEAGATITLDHDIVYNAAFDGDALKEGIVVDKAVTIVGADGIEICGNKLARVFKVAQGAALTLKDITVCHGAAEEGAGVYVENGATLVATGATFIENTAVTRGGAIYSEGTVDLKDSTLKENYVSNRGGGGDENKGGAALFNNGTLATLDNVQVIDNVKDYQNGDVLSAAIVAMGETTITNSYFSGNKARYGGAIAQTGTDKTLTVKNTVFNDNLAIFGGAIYDEAGPLVVEGCTFNENSGIGPGSAGTSSSQGGAILVMGTTSSAEITGSTFTKNSADLGGAISISDGTTGTFTIDDCTFTENTATDEGGAIYGYTTDSAITVKDSKFNKNNAPYGGAISSSYGTDLAVSGSEFTENTATYGGAILAGGDTTVSTSTFTDNSASAAYYSSAIHAWGNGNTLALSGNTIGTDERAQVYTQSGVSITSPLKVVVLNNETVNIHMAPYDITAVVTDDMGNKVVNVNFRFEVDGTVVPGISVDPTTGVYKATFTPTQTGEFVVSTNLAAEDNVKTGVLVISRSLTDLANIIAAAEAGDEITLDGDYAYIPEFDADLINGIVIDKAITIKGAEGADTISGSDLARLFKVVNGGDLTLDGVTITNGKAADGAAIYLESGAKLTATDSTFKDSTAEFSGGAIYATGATISLDKCTLDNNMVTDFTSNNDTGGAAIHAEGGSTLTIKDSKVTNNGNSTLDRSNGDLVNGVINLMNSDATITGTEFTSNTGIYGGAITTQAPAGAKTITIDDCTFTSNAAYTGGAVYVGDNVKFTISDSTFDSNNKATGEGTPGYTSGGGAIQIWHSGEGTIDNVEIKNSIATQGGAIGIETTAPVTIKDSKFTENTATSEGGAIYSYKNSDLTVTGCTFTDNDAPFGSAISNDGKLSLSGNTMTGGSVVPIANYYGTITSPVYVTTLDGQTVTTATATNDVTAVLKDDNGNAIIDKTLVLIVNGEEITTSYNKVTGIMTGSCTLTQPGTYAVTAKGIDAEHTTVGTLVYTAGTFTELQNLINAAEAGATITLDHDIVYNEAFDGDALKAGIVVDKAVTIVGAEGVEISGNNLARVFYVTETGDLTLKDTTITNGKASAGAAIYNKGTTTVIDSTFTNNVATYNGGAIYNLDGDVTVSGANTFTNNEATDGGAIYNLKYYEDSSKLTIEGSNVFSENEASDAGGAIYVYTGFAEEPGLTITGTNAFTENEATYGGAIFVNGKSSITGENTFTGNKATGTVDDYDAGGAIYADYGELTIDGAKFKENEGPIGGALYTNIVDLKLSNAEFTDNTAEYGGAIYIEDASENEGAQTGFEASVSNSVFSGNTATEGNAIYTDGALSLSGNTVSTTSADIVCDQGTIKSKVLSTILENKTYDWHIADFLINATLTDENGNLINDYNFKFIITYTAFRGTIEVPATFKPELGYYPATFTPDKAGEYLINLGYENEEVATSVIKVYKSLTDLANIIAAADAGAEITLDDDYAYIEAFDSALVNGIVIDKDITIKGAENANIINGSDLARLFKVTDGKTLTLDGVTIANGKADDGAGIYLESGAKLTATDSTFKDNTATYSGGAIYADGAQITLTDCVLDGNDVTDYTKNNDTGGAAIYGQSSTIALVNTNVTNNGNKELDRSKGDLVNGVINLMNSDATVTGCVFENNTGIYGGAITTQAPAGEKTLTISETNFTANAAYTGGAVYVGDNVKFTIEDSIFDANNKATGEGSPGYTSGGGAIQLWHAGEGTIDNVTIKNSIATQGGAIGVEGSSPVTIKDSTFTDNTATSEGGAIYAYNDAVLTVTGSTFSGNTAPWGNAISNDGTLTLSGNTVSTTSADIANYYGSIVSPISVSILGNDTTEGSGIVTAALGETVTITGVITDDNGNLIRDINFDYKVTNGDNIKEVHAVYNANTKQYEAEYVIENAGDHLVTITSDANNNLIINTGLYQVEKAKANLIVTVENIKEGEKAKVEVELIGADDTGLAGQPIIVRVNDVDYEITTGDDGKYSFEIDGLDVGRYDAVAVFEGNANYKLAFNSTIFDVKAEPGLSIFITDSKYGEHSYAIIALYSDGTLISGIVDITISGYDYPITVVCEDGGSAFNGYAEIPILPAGTYTYTATSRGTEDYLSVTTEPDTFTVSALDVVIDIGTPWIEVGKDGFSWVHMNVAVYDNEGNLLELDEEEGPWSKEVITPVTLVIKDKDGNELFRIEHAEPDEEGAIELPGTKDLAVGDYLITAIIEDADYNLVGKDTFDFRVVKNGLSVKIDGEEEISVGDKDTHSITLGTYEDDDQEEGEFFQVDFDGNAIVTIYNAVHDENGWIVPYRDDEGEVNAEYENAEAVKTLTVPVEDGAGTISFESLPLGEYVYVITLDDETYDCLADGIVCVDPKKGTYTDLQSLINRAIAEAEEDGREIAYLDLEYDFAYDEAYDADLIGGVVINKPIQINGNEKTISGSDLARIFYIPEDVSVEINLVTFANGAVADNGGAIYSAGNLTVHDSVFKDNKVTQGSTWAPGAPAAGGAAIYSAPGSSLDMWNNEFINNEAVHGLYNSFTCGAVYASGAEYVSIRDSKFEGNAAVLGGAVTIEFYHVDKDDEDLGPTIYNCDFIDNLAWQGGAVNINEDVPYLSIAQCRFNGNKAVDPNSGDASPLGGAISVGTSKYGTELVLNDCGFLGNSATNVGGAVAVINPVCELYADGCNFESNNAVAGGAIYFYGKEAEISHSNFNSNDPEYGGALFIAAGDVSIDNTQFENNEATLGGAIYIAKDGTLTIDDTVGFSKNTAEVSGGAIYTLGTLNVDGTYFGENTIEGSSKDAGGAAIYAGKDSKVTIKNANFQNNDATGSVGGAIYVMNASSISIDGANFQNNKADYGGAIVFENFTQDTAAIVNTRFERNTAVNGGALNINTGVEKLAIDNCDFYQNSVAGTAMEPQAVPLGGAVGVGSWRSATDLTITNCRFDDNKAEGSYGGALYLDKGSNLTISGCSFNNNVAYMASAIIFNGENVATIDSTSFTNNQVSYGTILVGTDADVTITNSYFEGNNGAANYYNIWNAGGDLSIKTTTFRTIYPTITMDDTEFAYGEDVTATGTFDWGTNNYPIAMEYTVDGVVATTTATNTKFTAELGDEFAVGTHTMVIKSFTDAEGNYFIVDAVEQTFTVTKATPVLEVEGDDYLMPGATATVGITLTGALEEGIAGTVIVTVDGKKYVVVTDANGEGSVDIAGLANGKYPITAEFIGNDNYGTVTNDTEFIDFYYRTATFDIVIDDVTYGDVITIIVENATDEEGNPLTGMVFGNIESANGDGAGLVVMVEDGSGTATVRKLNVGEYNVVATFTDEDYEYISEQKEFTFNVVKAQSTVDVTYADGEFTITLDGVAGEKLNESVSVLIDGVAYDAQTTVNGTITFAAPDLAVGKHTIEVAFAGNDNYLGSVDSFTFDIPKGIPTITVTGDSIDEGETATVTVTVKDGTTGVAGNAVVTVNGVDYAVTIAENGVGTVDIDGLPYGEYPIAAKFLGNDDYEAAVFDGTAKVVVESDVATFDIVIENITYGEGLVVIVENATDAAGNPLNGMVIGNIENATGQGAGLIVYVTNGKGSRTYTGLTAGDYDVVATFYDDDYEWFSKTKEFTVNVAQAEPTVGVTYADGAITITLDGVNGEKLNETVTVAIDGTPVNIEAVTENGTFTFTPTVAPGAHLVEVEFAGNHNYVAGSAYTSFEAPKLTPTITVTGDVVDFEEVATVNVTVMAGETPVAGNAVVTVNGVNYAVTIGADGKGFVDIENLPFGEYPITAKFLANDKYEAAVYSGDAKVVVNMPTDVTFDLAVDDGLTTVTVSDATNAAGEAIDGYIMGVLMKDGQKVATLDMGTLADGTGTLALPADLDAGDYTVMVTVKDGDMKLTGTDEINFTVEPKAAVVTGDAADYAFDQTGKLEINVTDVAETPIAGNVTVVIDEGPYATVEINGNTVIDLTGFDIGAHIVKVIFTNPNYRDAEWVGGFNVTKVTPTITVTGDVVDFEEVATVNVTVMAGETPVAGNAVVTVNGVNYAVTIGADGKGFVDIENLPFGEYPITAKFLANDKYEAAVYSGDAKVVVNMPTDITFDLAVNDDLTTVTVSNAKDAAGNAIDGYVMGELFKDGRKVADLEFGTLEDGTGTIAIPAGLDAGDYTVMVTVMDDNMASGTDEINFTVEPKAAVVTGDAADYAFDQTGKLEINVTDVAETPIAGNVTVVIDEGPYATVEINGNTVIDLTGFDIGAHIVKVIFTNPNYRDAEWVGGFNVTKVTPTITVTGDVVDFEEVATVNVTVMAGETPVAGNAVVTVNGVNYAVEIGADGTGTLTIAGLAANEYPIAAKFLANDKYEEAVYSGDAKVVVGPSKDLTIEVTANEPSVGQDTIITVTATDGSGAAVPVDKVNVTINGVTTEYPVAADGTVNIGALPAGETPVTVSVDDGVHTLATKDITAVVSTPTVLGTNITVTVDNITYGESAVIKFTLTDENNNPLTGILNVTVKDIVKEVPVDDGHGTLTLPSLTADTYPVVANFEGNDAYGPSTGTGYFNVAKKATKIIYENMTTNAIDFYTDGRVGEWFVWRLVDEDGNPMKNTPMQIGFNGIVYTYEENGICTDDDGYARLQINLMTSFTYTFAISFLGDENYNASFAVAKIDVLKQTPTISVPNKSYKASASTKTLTATFKNNRGTLIANKTIKFTVNGKTYSAKTDEKGVAKVNVSISKKGTYDVTMTYGGSGTYEKVTKKATLKIT